MYKNVKIEVTEHGACIEKENAHGAATSHDHFDSLGAAKKAVDRRQAVQVEFEPFFARQEMLIAEIGDLPARLHAARDAVKVAEVALADVQEEAYTYLAKNDEIYKEMCAKHIRSRWLDGGSYKEWIPYEDVNGTEQKNVSSGDMPKTKVSSIGYSRDAIRIEINEGYDRLRTLEILNVN